VLATQVVGGLAIAFGEASKPLQQVPYAITPFLVLLGIPVAMAIAILQRRLFDIDVIISRALLFTLLSAGITAVYAAIVLGIGTFVGHRGSPLLTVAAAVVIAVVFQPLRQRAGRLANRVVYGERATPYQVLSDFAAGMAGQLDLGVALDRMVSLLGGAAGAARVEAWVRVGAELRPAAVWPGGSAPSPVVRLNGAAGLPVLDPGARMVPVRHGDDLLGAISLAKPPNESLSSAEDGLLAHLASQAGLVMRNAQLTAELRATIEELLASRRRLVGPRTSRRSSAPRSTTCARWPAGSTRRCWPSRAWSRRSARRPPAARSRSSCRRTRSAATRRTPRAPSTSARWRRCRTWPGTPAPRPSRSAWSRPARSWSSPSATTAPASPPPPGMVPACRACRTGWPRTAAPCRHLPARPGHHHHRPPPHIGADERSRALPGQPRVN
jgi:hypothetical protein